MLGTDCSLEMDFTLGVLLRISRDFMQLSLIPTSMVLLQLVSELVKLKVIQECLCRLQYLWLKLFLAAS